MCVLRAESGGAQNPGHASLPGKHAPRRPQNGYRYDMLGRVLGGLLPGLMTPLKDAAIEHERSRGCFYVVLDEVP
jgi:hypothetical protein